MLITAAHNTTTGAAPTATMTPQQVLQTFIHDKEWGDIMKYLTAASTSSSSSCQKDDGKHVLLGKINKVACSDMIATATATTGASTGTTTSATAVVDNCFHLALVQRAPFYVMNKMIQMVGQHGILTTLTPDNQQWTALHLACRYYGGTLFEKPTIQLLLDVGGGMELAKCKDTNGCTALDLACANCKVTWDVIQIILKSKAGDVNDARELVMMRDKNGYTALHHACRRGQSYDDNVIQVLLEMGGPNLALVKDSQGKTVLHHAVIMSSVVGGGGGGKTLGGYFHFIGRLLYLCGQCLLSQKDQSGWNALHYLCMQGDAANEHVLKSLLDVGGVNLVMSKNGKDGLTALHMACARGVSGRLIQMLLNCIGHYGREQGQVASRLLTKDKQGWTVLDHVIVQKNKDKYGIVRLLLDAGGKNLVLARHKLGQTILHKACARKEVYPVVQLLLDVGGKDLVSMNTKNGMTALFEACKHKNYCNVVKLLLDVGGKELVMMTHTKSGSTILHNVCMQKGSVEVVKLLLDVGGKDLVMVKDQHGCTALHKACKHHHQDYTIDVIQLLLNVGGQSLVLVQDDRGCTALHDMFACVGSSHSMGIIQVLLDVGGQALAKVSDETGSTALHMACKYGTSHKAIAQLLHVSGSGDDGSDHNDFVTMRDKNGLTALHVLCQSNNNTESMKSIFKKATLLKTKAARGNHEDSLIYMKTNQGKVAFQVLLESRYPELHNIWQLLTSSSPSSSDDACTDATTTSCQGAIVSNSSSASSSSSTNPTNVTQDPPMSSLPPPINVNYAKVKCEEDNIPVMTSSSHHLLGNIQEVTQPIAIANETPHENHNVNNHNHDDNDADVDNLQQLHSQLTATFTKLEQSLKRKRQELLELECTVHGKKARMDEMQTEVTTLVTAKDKLHDPPPTTSNDLLVQRCKSEHI